MEQNRPGYDEMYCSSCGSIVKKLAEICVHCGVRLNNPSVQSAPIEFSEKSRVTAGILGILLGGLGIHRFYLGNIVVGILQIIVSVITLGMGGIWGLIEGIIIIAGGSWRDGQGKPLKKYGDKTKS